MATASKLSEPMDSMPEARSIAGLSGDDCGYALTLGLSEAMYDRIEELTAQTPGATEADILNRAVGLYKTVFDAIRSGKRVGILEDPNVELETEFVDF